jgi:hypothetical protein
MSDEPRSYRPLTPFERELLERMLAVEGAEKQTIAQQLDAARVTVVDDHGSFWFELPPDGGPVSKMRAEAEALDEDGVGIHVLLFESEGRVKELQVYKDDDTPIRRFPKAPEFAVTLVLTTP